MQNIVTIICIAFLIYGLWNAYKLLFEDNKSPKMNSQQKKNDNVKEYSFDKDPVEALAFVLYMGAALIERGDGNEIVSMCMGVGDSVHCAFHAYDCIMDAWSRKFPDDVTFNEDGLFPFTVQQYKSFKKLLGYNDVEEYGNINLTKDWLENGVSEGYFNTVKSYMSGQLSLEQYSKFLFKDNWMIMPETDKILGIK